jgi:hypothetical protein
MVALTGIEPAGCRFSSAQFGVSSCVFGRVQFTGKALRAARVPDVLPWCCPGAQTSDSGLALKFESVATAIIRHNRPLPREAPRLGVSVVGRDLSRGILRVALSEME